MNSNEIRPGSYCCINGLSREDRLLVLDMFISAGASRSVFIEGLGDDTALINKFSYIVWHVEVNVAMLYFTRPAYGHCLDAHLILDQKEKPTPNPWEVDCDLE